MCTRTHHLRQVLNIRSRAEQFLEISMDTNGREEKFQWVPILNLFTYRCPVIAHDSVHIDQNISVCLFNAEENTHLQ